MQVLNPEPASLYKTLEQRLHHLRKGDVPALFRGRLIGIERECLRVNAEGKISQAPHPPALGSALTHPAITTDYSEALLEFITPPLDSMDAVYRYLIDIGQFVHSELGDELLWATSMPCVVEGDASIPIAEYGSSNIGTMKTVYRRGLGYRYGRMMQVIAGVHYNYSFPRAFWERLYEREGGGSLQDFVSAGYFALLRNLKRHDWLVALLFGASPAVCKSFLGAQPGVLPAFNENTHYLPWGTSLRLSDIGYQNSREKESGIKADYSSLEAYTASLEYAITTPCPEYEKIGVKVDGEYRQLNANILQIENEYYSSTRPKQLCEDMEKPITALRRRGVRYVELRSLDVNPFDPAGISLEQMLFLETLIVYAALLPSPPFDSNERREVDGNMMLAATRGREPGLTLSFGGEQVSLRQRAIGVFDRLHDCCELLVEATGDARYRDALARMREVVNDPALSLSARMLDEMRSRGQGFFDYSQAISAEQRAFYTGLPPRPEMMQKMREMARESVRQQQEIEAGDSLSFDDYLAAYMAGG